MMKDKFFRFLERFNNAFKTFGQIVTWGSFISFIIIGTIIYGFPNGFLSGLFFGAFFALFSWLRFRISYNRAVEARKKLQAYSLGQKKKL
jgi:hypothetical protein